MVLHRPFEPAAFIGSCGLQFGDSREDFFLILEDTKGDKWDPPETYKAQG
jgi:hypothetical protein